MTGAVTLVNNVVTEGVAGGVVSTTIGSMEENGLALPAASTETARS